MYICKSNQKNHFYEMQNLQDNLKKYTQKAVTEIFGVSLENVEIQQTKKEFDGDLTIVIFPMLRQIKGNPQQIGEQIGAFLQKKYGRSRKF